jgi:diaminohydroxyphosphoribosylaminopyrimidine deaminase/5-amino-6-(5-phosphoribosylamino)uracil reductase
VDPNPEVSGQGVERLRQAGIEVDVGVLEAQARALNPGYVRRISGGLPYVRCKLAMSLDGRAAMRDGTSKWITSEAARRDAQFLRARSDAILTGSGTLTYDDPSLNVRLAPEEFPCDLSAEEVPQPLRVVLDSNLKMNTSARMLSLPGKTLILCTRFDPSRAGKLERAGGQVIQLQDEKGRIYLKDALAYLGDRGLNEILIEAGPTVAGQALHEGVLDEIVIYVAPHLMGDDARGLFHLPWIEKMEDRIPLEIREIRQIGSDLRVTAVPRARGGN